MFDFIKNILLWIFAIIGLAFVANASYKMVKGASFSSSFTDRLLSY